MRQAARTNGLRRSHAPSSSGECPSHAASTAFTRSHLPDRSNRRKKSENRRSRALSSWLQDRDALHVRHHRKDVMGRLDRKTCRSDGIFPLRERAVKQSERQTSVTNDSARPEHAIDAAATLCIPHAGTFIGPRPRPAEPRQPRGAERTFPALAEYADDERHVRPIIERLMEGWLPDGRPDLAYRRPGVRPPRGRRWAAKPTAPCAAAFGQPLLPRPHPAPCSRGITVSASGRPRGRAPPEHLAAAAGQRPRREGVRGRAARRLRHSWRLMAPDDATWRQLVPNWRSACTRTRASKRDAAMAQELRHQVSAVPGGHRRDRHTQGAIRACEWRHSGATMSPWTSPRMSRPSAVNSR